MPTPEERLATLEQSFGSLQKEIGKSIREVNENSTIMLGLLQTLTQESKQTGLRMEMMKIRLDQLETKFDAHTALLNEHTRVLSEHTVLLNATGKTLASHRNYQQTRTTRIAPPSMDEAPEAASSPEELPPYLQFLCCNQRCPWSE